MPRPPGYARQGGARCPPRPSPIGHSTRGPDETPSREEALRLYTVGSAWFCFDETRRGTLENGKLADFAILDRDFMSVPVEQIGATASLLTVVGGKLIYAADVFANAK